MASRSAASGTAAAPRGESVAARSAAVPLAADLDAINLEFTDGRLTLVRVNYRPTNKWESKDQFLSVVAAQLGTAGTWQPFYDWRDREVRDTQSLRDLALECPGYRLRVGIGIEGVGADQTPHIALEDVAAARAIMQREDEKKRRETEQKGPQKP